MRLPADNPVDRPRSVRTANDRLKASQHAMLHRSIVLSVLLHVAVVLSWPNIDPSTLAAGSPSGMAPLQLVTLGALGSPAPVRSLAPAPIAVLEESQGEDESSGSGGDSERGGDEGTAPEGWERRSAELWRLAALRPDMTPAPRSEPVDAFADSTRSEGQRSDGEEEEGLRIRRGTEELEFQRLSEEEALSLERLSALRPELVLVSPSSWLIVRNPDEVGRFLRKRMDDYAPELATGGSLAVSLWVDERGSVEWAEINQSSGHPSVDESALELFRTVVAFRPAREEGMRVPVAAIFWLMW
jgi:TonB family protein